MLILVCKSVILLNNSKFSIIEKKRPLKGVALTNFWETQILIPHNQKETTVHKKSKIKNKRKRNN